MIRYNSKLKNHARQLRQNMTKAERLLWSRIRRKQLGFQFYRQRIIGNYIVDFYCPKARLVIEVDGGQHNENKKDKERNRWLKNQGLNVLRFWNNEVLNNIEGVIEKINLPLSKGSKGIKNPPFSKGTHSPSPFPKGGPRGI